MTKLKEEDVDTMGDSIHITLPAAEVLNTIVNPSGFETFDEKGDWSEEAAIALKVKIKNKITGNAVKQNILNQANLRSKTIIETFLKNTGFNKVEISIRN